MKNATFGKALLFHGGGLCANSNRYLSRLAVELTEKKIFDGVLMGFYSFECLVKPDENIKEWSALLQDQAEHAAGGFYGTHRCVNLADPETQKIALETCEKMGIRWIFVAGGDGSSRQVAEVAEAFEARGIHFCLPIPLTCDGIEGGESLGVQPAAEVSFKVIEQICATNLQTKDGDGFSVAMVEVQGRNRDDILANVLKKVADAKTLGGIPTADIDIFWLPANYPWSLDVLFNRIVGVQRRTLILLSEGAAKQYDLKKKKDIKAMLDCQRKTRYTSVGYLCQMSDCITHLEANTIRQCISTAIPLIVQEVTEEGKSFSLVYQNLYSTPEVYDIAYYARLNPREGQVATLKKDLAALISFYAPYAYI